MICNPGKMAAASSAIQVKDFAEQVIFMVVFSRPGERRKGSFRYVMVWLPFVETGLRNYYRFTTHLRTNQSARPPVSYCHLTTASPPASTPMRILGVLPPFSFASKSYATPLPGEIAVVTDGAGLYGRRIVRGAGRSGGSHLHGQPKSPRIGA